MNAHRLILRDICGDLLAGRRDEVVDAIVADGWPRAMVEAGLDLHARTWVSVDLIHAYEAELAANDMHHPPPGIPDNVLHIWPRLPGAGVTPVLYGVALGVPSQRIRASHAGERFAEVFLDIAENHAPGRVERDTSRRLDAAVVVVSGSDDTIAAVRHNTSPDTRLIGYGHRVSFAVVEAGTNAASRIAEDVVMWHQMGCFSVRGVIVVGDADAADRFAARLADSIAEWERRWDATHLDNDQLAERAQALGVAEFQGQVWHAEVGWTTRRDGLPDGAWLAPHAVVVHNVSTIDDIGFDLVSGKLQGISIAGSPAFFRDVTARVEALGATRTCRVGELQSPPASWPHDGRPNVIEWLQRNP